MGDETETITSSDSEFTDNSFIGSDDDSLLNWDSDDSRPAAPSPPSTPSQTMSQPSATMDLRRRLRPRRQLLVPRVVPFRPGTLSDNASTADSQRTGRDMHYEFPDSWSDETTMDSVTLNASDSFRLHEPVVNISSDEISSPDNSQAYSPHSPENSPPDSDLSDSDDLSNPDSPLLFPDSPPMNSPESPAAVEPDGGPESPDLLEVEQDVDSGSPVEDVQIIEPPIEETSIGAVAESQPNNTVRPLQITTEAAQSNPTVSASNREDEAAIANISVLSEGEENSLCSICMDPLTNYGAHRIVCLKCGHIFGHSCLERWIKVGCNNGAKRCPTCNKRACLKDIRILYLPKVVPLDTVEKDRLIREKEEVAAQKVMVEQELYRCKLVYHMATQSLENKISELDKKYKEAQAAVELLSRGIKPCPLVAKTDSDNGGYSLKLLHSVELRKEGGCRVMTYNTITQQLVVSQQSGNTVFAGFGVRILPSVDFQPTRFFLLHQKMIRDLAFHPEDRHLLLSVSLDQTAKLVDLACNATVHTFKGDGPLWSGCWEASNPHLLLVGSQMGQVRQYDRRMMDHYLNVWVHKENATPVVALASAPSVASTLFPQGGFFSCRLNKVLAYSRHGDMYESQELRLDGPFMSMRYDHGSQTLLTSTRPSSRSSHVKVNLNLVDVNPEGSVCTPQIHTFTCGSSARVLSRLATLSVCNDSLVVAHDESGRTVNMWSTKSGDLVHRCPIKEPVIDITGIPLNNKCLLSTLSDKTVQIYKVTL